MHEGTSNQVTSTTPNTTPNSFGSWLKQRRKALALTQEDLAMRIDCSWETVRKIESGVRHPSKQVADLLADFFHITPEQRPAFVHFARTGEGAERFSSIAQSPGPATLRPEKRLG